jgi:hypothetical protein
MKKNVTLALLVLVGVCSSSARSQLVGNFDDIEFWSGSGTNRAALVLQWNDGLRPVSLAWGYRWNGEASGLQMVKAIAGSTKIYDLEGNIIDASAGSDPRLALGLLRYSFGDAVQSITLAGDGPIRTQADWLAGYWEYYIFGGHFLYYDWYTDGMVSYDQDGSVEYPGAGWLYAPVGGGDRPLVDGAWDALSFAPDFAGQELQQPEAASLPLPEITLQLSGADPVVSFVSVIGLSYQLLYSDNLAEPFVPLGSSAQGTGGVLQFADETPDLPSQRFYRVSVSP